MDINRQIMELENAIAVLPQGSINIKKINGKDQPYLQWTENGKSKSKYIKKGEREQIFAGVERRKQLQDDLLLFARHLFHLENIVVYSELTVLMNIFVMAVHCVPVSWISMMKI